MKNNLYICNTPFQVIVAVWFKYHYHKDIKSTILVSDIFSSQNVIENLKKLKVFDQVFLVRTKEFLETDVQISRIQNIRNLLFPLCELNKIIKLREKYDDVYAANFDHFTQLIFNTLSAKNLKLKLHIYEDSLSTYSTFESCYRCYKNFYFNEAEDVNKPIKRFLHQKVYHTKTLYGNLEEMFVFSPELFQWNPGCKITKADKIDIADKIFVKLVNSIFGYDESPDCYDRQYIFLEEAYFADGYKINDVEILNQVADIVGKDNIMVKIHPRNPINRFAKLGYKTNVDISTPWEVVLMNMENIQKKRLITISSTAILNPIINLGVSLKAFSMYNFLREVPSNLAGQSWNFTKGLYSKYDDMITICNTIEDLC